MTIDIIIPTAKKIETINPPIYFVIRSILIQTIQPQNIFIIENEDNLGVREFLNDSFGKLVTIIDGTANKPNISFARNLGAKHSKSDILLFMDDDVVIGKNDFLKQVAKNMLSLDFYCGANRYWSETNWNEYLNTNFSINHIHRVLKERSFRPLSIERNSGKRNFHDYTFIGNFGAIKRKVFDVLNGFDENYKGWLYQDTDFMMRLCYYGYEYQLMAYDELFVYHLSHSTNKAQFYNQNREYYYTKQKEFGIKFNLGFFFGYFNNNQNLSIIEER